VAKYLPTKLGDATFHHGWTLHGADHNREPQKGGRDRTALAISYFEDGVSHQDPDHEVHGEEQGFWEQWAFDLQHGDAVEHALLPLIDEL